MSILSGRFDVSNHCNLCSHCVLQCLCWKNDTPTKKKVSNQSDGKGSKPRKVIIIEVILEIATCIIVVVQLISVFANISILSPTLRIIGGCISVVGVLISLYRFGLCVIVGVPELLKMIKPK